MIEGAIFKNIQEKSYYYNENIKSSMSSISYAWNPYYLNMFSDTLDNTESSVSPINIPPKSSALSLLKFAGIWERDDMDECMEIVNSTRLKMEI